MDAAIARRRAFFVLYFVALVSTFIWVHCDYVQRRSQTDLRNVYIAFAGAGVYLALRAYLVLRERVSEGWEYVWLAMDLFLITAGVHLTGRMGSDLALLYFWPLVTTSVQRRPGLTSGVGLAVAGLYTAATLPEAIETGLTARLAARLFVVAAATAVAVAYAVTEAARVEELTLLRERLALSGYRAQLSREMHDGIQHYLVRIATRLHLAKMLIERDPPAAARMAIDQALTVRQASDELRYLVRRLRAPVVEQLGFIGALQEHLGMFAERSGAAAELHLGGEPRRLPADVEHAAFRIIQEALTNTEKYAGASRVDVRVEFGADFVQCSVQDDGRGFDASATPTELAAEGGFGLTGMRERAASAGGEVAIRSAPGEGTTVTLRAPLAPEEGSAGHAEDPPSDR
ncbi:MAG: sensor histidine kinase [Armatimonadetes bacterium]|nr:sensor histidine kinase [Armatimonadota bacterium]